MEKVLPQKFRGVQFDKRRNKWFATIKIKGKNKYLGAFQKFEDAVLKRLEAEELYQKPEKVKRLEFEKMVVSDYISGLSMNVIGNKVGYHQTSIREILLKHKVDIRNNEVNIDEERCLKLYDDGMTMECISDEFGVSLGCIRNKLTKHGRDIRPNRKYFFDESIFNKIDCEWKAYYLGFFYADAGMTELSLKLSLQEKDKEILDKLNKIVFNNQYELKYAPYKKYHNKATNQIRNCNPQYSIIINSKKVINDLHKLGCGIKKSLTLKFPNNTQVPKEYMHHFIRGYFDGDGCIIKRSWQVISSDDFCNDLQRYLYNELNINSYLKKCGNVSRVFIHKKRDILKIKDYMYKDSTIFLKRKRDKFINLDYV